MEKERDTVSPLHSFESNNSATEDLGKTKYERKVTLEQQYIVRIMCRNDESSWLFTNRTNRLSANR